mgnify:CR=1 FL=1
MSVIGLLAVYVCVFFFEKPEKSKIEFLMWLNSGFLMEIFLIIGLNYAYFTTISILRKNHGKRYDEIKVSMKFFYIIETFPLTLTVLLDIYGTVYYYVNNSEIKI